MPNFPASCKLRPACSVQSPSFDFAYQFEQIHGLEDFDAEFPRHPQMPFVKGYHIIASPGNSGFEYRVIARIGRKRTPGKPNELTVGLAINHVQDVRDVLG